MDSSPSFFSNFTFLFCPWRAPAERAEKAEIEAEESADQGAWEQQRRASEARIAIAAAQVLYGLLLVQWCLTFSAE